MEKVEKLQDKAKYAAFYKTKIECKKPTKVVEKKDAAELLRKQSDQIEKEIIKIKQTNQGRSSKVFQMK